MKSGSSTGLNWQEYEAVTKYIYEMLGATYGIKVIGYGKDCKLEGKSGVKHQVDVLTEQLDGGLSHRTAIECKFLNKKVTKEIVMKLHSIMSDAGIESGIIVCKKGYTPDTLTYAEHQGIRLVELREVEKDEAQDEHNINAFILDLNIQVTITRANIISIDLGSTQITDEDEIREMHFSNDAIILTPDGIRIPFGTYLTAYCKEVSRQNQLLKTITINYPPVKGKLIRMDNDDQPDIEKISFTGFLCEIDASSKRSFQVVDQVWMIMKEIFEKKSYKLSKSGMLFRDIGEY
ncbi:hypothetical protein GFS24_20785 [Chitinophaga sp. SYP-B3965]|uniref:restriction endonuclease n=1 Tax=Chitinophaga sp. SYP-B3965 TaxID=2663120 RepID=UPI001299C552|nr:restriction endonuclease [Chitinophaga sp. SYP-B3965]MRG47571.1 hypothetical protein [Chitinophaga sp. SYP-B3965]